MKNIFVLPKVLIVLSFFVFQQSLAFASSAEKNEMVALDKYYALLNKGDRFASEGQNEQALACYQGALALAKNADGEVVARGSLLKFYENSGEFKLALEEVEWFLKRNLTAPGRARYQMARQRLLKKIEAEKRGEKVDESNQTVNLTPPIRKVSDFHKAGYGSQKAFLEKELPEDSDVLRLSKQGLLAEHSGDFRKAKECYEKLLAQKDGVIAAHGEVAWVMLHPAVQRTAEVTGDEAQEKEMLVWIRDNMLAEQGAYRRYLPGLLPDVQDHLKERLKKFALGS